jgi:hypothetical protein
MAMGGKSFEPTLGELYAYYLAQKGSYTSVIRRREAKLKEGESPADIY